jgi:hypothetical protein
LLRSSFGNEKRRTGKKSQSATSSCDGREATSSEKNEEGISKDNPQLPDLKQSKSAVLNSLSSLSSERFDHRAIRDFVD